MILLKKYSQCWIGAGTLSCSILQVVRCRLMAMKLMLQEDFFHVQVCCTARLIQLWCLLRGESGLLTGRQKIIFGIKIIQPHKIKLLKKQKNHGEIFSSIKIRSTLMRPKEKNLFHHRDFDTAFVKIIATGSDGLNEQKTVDTNALYVLEK